MPDRLIGYTTDPAQQAEIERAGGAGWKVTGWAPEAPPAPAVVAARPGLGQATARLVGGEADGLVVRSLADLSEQPVQLGVLEYVADPRAVLARLPAVADRLVLTYHPRFPGHRPAQRPVHLTPDELDRVSRDWAQVGSWRAHRIFAGKLGG